MKHGGGGERNGGGGGRMLALVRHVNLVAGTPLLAGWDAGGRQAPTLAGWNFCLLPLGPGLPSAAGIFIAGSDNTSLGLVQARSRRQASSALVGTTPSSAWCKLGLGGRRHQPWLEQHQARLGASSVQAAGVFNAGSSYLRATGLEQARTRLASAAGVISPGLDNTRLRLWAGLDQTCFVGRRHQSWLGQHQPSALCKLGPGFRRAQRWMGQPRLRLA